MEEKLVLRLTFNPGLALTGFRTTRPKRAVHTNPSRKRCFSENAGLSSGVLQNASRAGSEGGGFRRLYIG